MFSIKKFIYYEFRNKIRVFFNNVRFDALKRLNTWIDCHEISVNLPLKKQEMITWKDVIHFAVNGNPTPDRRVEKTEDEWKEQLTLEQFRITRLKGTERPFSGELCSIFDEGTYSCVCCDTPLFDSTIKFNSSSGWPSFTQPIEENAIKYEKDTSHGMVRVEVMCNVCDAHLGHVFPDGPEPSGLRYCINSESMKLIN
jgi:peptide-methionine (R)-S-oxide reductase